MRTRTAWGWIPLLAALGAAGCGGEVIGIGNSGNRIGAVGVLDEVAQLLAESPATPRVSDAMVREVFEAISERASEGDTDAALVLLSVGQLQREADED